MNHLKMAFAVGNTINDRLSCFHSRHPLDCCFFVLMRQTAIELFFSSSVSNFYRMNNDIIMLEINMLLILIWEKERERQTSNGNHWSLFCESKSITSVALHFDSLHINNSSNCRGKKSYGCGLSKGSVTCWSYSIHGKWLVGWNIERIMKSWWINRCRWTTTSIVEIFIGRK